MFSGGYTYYLIFWAIDYKNGIRKKKTGERFGKLLRGPGLEAG